MLKKTLLFFTLFSTLLLADQLSIKDIDNQEINVTVEEKGISFQTPKKKVVFLLLFGHNCKPCLKEVPELVKFTNEKHEDATIFAFDIHGYNQKDLEAFKKEHDINYPLFTRGENKKFLLEIKQKANWHGTIPYLLVFNKKGEIKLAHYGTLNAQKFEKIYEALK